MGEVNSGAPGKMAVYANYDPDSNNYKGLIQCEVRTQFHVNTGRVLYLEHLHIQ